MVVENTVTWGFVTVSVGCSYSVVTTMFVVLRISVSDIQFGVERKPVRI